MAMGEAQAALELTLDYVTTRKAFGATLFEKQAIRQRLAMLAAKVEAGRQLVYHAAWLDARGRRCTREVSMVKAYCGELVNEVMYACLQFHGGMGYHARVDDRAHGARCPRAGDRRRRHRGDAGGGREAAAALTPSRQARLGPGTERRSRRRPSIRAQAAFAGAAPRNR